MFGRTYQELANTYSAMGAMLDAGVGLYEVLNFQEESGAEPARAQRLATRLRAGAKFHFALRAERFPQMEVALVKAGEETGELVHVLKLLGDYYSDRSVLDRNLKAALFKPFVLFAVAVVCTALPSFVLGYLSTLQFLLVTALPISTALAFLVLFFELVWRATRNPALDRWLDLKFANIPMGQLLSKPIAEERFFMSFMICIKAGTSLETLTDILKLVSDHPALQGATDYIPTVAPADGLASAFEKTGLFDPSIISGIRVGEKTGRLEQQLAIILKETRGKVDYRIKEFREWVPRLLYSLIAIFVALNILMIGLRKT